MNKGLYQEAYEHDACGVGMVVNIHGGKSHELVDNALKVLENMEHRGAETRDKTALLDLLFKQFHLPSPSRSFLSVALSIVRFVPCVRG